MTHKITTELSFVHHFVGNVHLLVICVIPYNGFAVINSAILDPCFFAVLLVIQYMFAINTNLFANIISTGFFLA